MGLPRQLYHSKDTCVVRSLETSALRKGKQGRKTEEAPVGKRDKPQKARVWERVKAKKGDKSSKSSLNTAVWKPLVSREGLQLSNALLQLFFFF